jgi:hypothetical protein
MLYVIHDYWVGGGRIRYELWLDLDVIPLETSYIYMPCLALNPLLR